VHYESQGKEKVNTALYKRWVLAYLFGMQGVLIFLRNRGAMREKKLDGLF